MLVLRLSLHLCVYVPFLVLLTIYFFSFADYRNCLTTVWPNLLTTTERYGNVNGRPRIMSVLGVAPTGFPV